MIQEGEMISSTDSPQKVSSDSPQKVSFSTIIISDEKETPGENKDYNPYTILGLEIDANEKQIISAHKKLSLKFHPDRNPYDESAIQQYNAINEAFELLSDPLKRAAYDSKNSHQNNISNVSISQSQNNDPIVPIAGNIISGINNAFKGVMTRLTIHGAPQEIIDTAFTLAKYGNLDGLGGPPSDPRLQDLPFGWSNEVKVDRQVAAYFRITIDSKQVSNGFFINCKSHHKGKFKFFLLNKDGEILFQQDSQKSKDGDVIIYFTRFPTYQYNPDICEIDASSVNSHNISEMENEELLPIFSMLNGFKSNRQSIVPGQYLLCIYGENIIGKTTVNILISTANNSLTEVAEILETDESIIEIKTSIENLKDEYIQAKTAYDLVMKKLRSENNRIDSLFVVRERAYKGFLDKSASIYMPNNDDDSTSSANQSGLISSFTTATSTIFNAVTSNIRKAGMNSGTEDETNTQTIQATSTDSNDEIKTNDVKAQAINAVNKTIGVVGSVSGWLGGHVRTAFNKVNGAESSNNDIDGNSVPVASNEVVNTNNTPDESKKPILSLEP